MAAGPKRELSFSVLATPSKVLELQDCVSAQPRLSSLATILPKVGAKFGKGGSMGYPSWYVVMQLPVTSTSDVRCWLGWESPVFRSDADTPLSY